ncbi:hypothetical protein [Sagittula sp. S175]|uniref:hypothetical protein n=1 Tax=Sagittula sp. S175 TaxID=3415129 RepID=UPI003C79831F
MAEASAEVGTGSPLTATITRRAEGDETTYPPVQGVLTDYTTNALVSSYSARDRQGTNISDRDLKVMLAVPLVDSLGNETAPLIGDTLALSDGRALRVVNVTALQPGGVAIYWTCQARAGE